VERDAEIVVVGAGVAGLAAARALAREGRDVLLVEQHEVGHAHGSSHGATRIFRLSYPDPQWVRLAQAALPLWRGLEAEAGEPLLATAGSLDVGAPEANRAALAACGARYELLDRSAAERRFRLSLPAGRVLLQPDGAVIRADSAQAALLASAREAGARLAERTHVLALADEGTGVRLETSAGPLRARAALVTAGAWAPALLAGAGIALAVVATRETVCHFQLPSANELPSVIDWLTPSTAGYRTPRTGQLSYALPDPTGGLKAGLHHSGPPADPDAAGVPDGETVRWLSDWVAGRFPEAAPEPAGVTTCLYTSTADEAFVLERRGRIVVGSACSGHGFKFAPAIGRTLAALAGEAAR
jgi:sarcosine oxidase